MVHLVHRRLAENGFGRKLPPRRGGMKLEGIAPCF
jgi:hypothetical protein